MPIYEAIENCYYLDMCNVLILLRNNLSFLGRNCDLR